MRYSLLTAIVFLIAVNCQAQQLQTSSLYSLQGTLQNPSTAGVEEHNFIGATYRSQWNGIPGSPQTATVFGSFNLPKQKVGIAGYVYNDKTGPTSRTGVVLSLAKHIVMDNGDKFSLGLENRIQQYRIDVTKLATYGSDPVLAGADSKINYDAGFGLSYTSSRFQAGASVAQIVQSGLSFYTGNLPRTEKARLYRHYYFHGLYNIAIDDVTTITPHFVYTYLPNAPSDVQLGVRVNHNGYFWYGAGYRVDQNFILSAGVTINKKLVIGYAYDEYVSPINYFHEGGIGHEVVLRYNFVK